MPVPDQEEVPPYTSIESNQQLIPMQTYRSENQRDSASGPVAGVVLRRNEANNDSGDENDGENLNEDNEQSALKAKLQNQMMVTPQVSYKDSKFSTLKKIPKSSTLDVFVS